MKNKILFVFIFLFLFCFKNVSANELCSSNGYTVLTINGIFTKESGAIENKNNLKRKFSNIYNNQPLIVDFLYNPTHLGGLGDIVDVLAQMVVDRNDDYDMTEMLNDASQKVTTQKLLLVGHSQGNFYANNLYDAVASEPGGVPKESIGVYGVATPASRVAGGGKYLTSSSDTVINSLAARLVNDKILPSNIVFPLQSIVDGSNGHSFSDVYLRYAGDKIVSDIKSSLDKLQNNDEQSPQDPCISPPELTLIHKAWGVGFTVADAIINNSGRAAVYIADGSYNTGATIGNFFHNTGLTIGKTLNGLFANAFESLPDPNSMAAVLPDLTAETPQNSVKNPPETSAENNSPTKPESVSENVEIEIPPATEETVVIPEETSSSEVLTDENKKPETSVVPENLYPNLLPGAGGGSGGDNDRGGGGGGNPPSGDVTAPILTITGTDPVDVEKDTVYIDAGATALDDIDGDLTSSIVKSGTFTDTAIIGAYTVIYTVSDVAGNISTKTRTVNVVAPPPPSLNTTTIDVDTTLTAGEYNYENLVITNNAILTLESDLQSANTFKGVKINAVNITVDNGSSIVANGKGYTNGPGTPSGLNFYAGGSYGGIGDTNTTALIYGSAKEPMDLGSGGADGYHGGGAIRLVITNTFINNGVISANGEVNASGGSIYITTDSMSGNGSFNANGGDIHAGNAIYRPGGGGRIALYYKTNSFNGKAEALGGCGSPDGFSKICAGDGTVGFFDTLNNDFFVYSSWLFQKNDSPFNFRHIVFTNGAKVNGEDTVNITANDLLVDKISLFTLASNQNISIPSITIDGGSTFTLSDNEIFTTDTITVKGNSIVTVIPEKILSLSVSNINIETGSSISVDGKGYKQGNGPGAATGTHFYAGASHGGLGWDNIPGSIYGSETEPVDFGSSGTGVHVAGGGAIRLIITNTLSNDGVISANGDSTSSGGSVYVTTKNLAGSGLFSANGGSGQCGSTCNGPGGGGRVAIYYETSSFSAQNIRALGASNGDRTSGNGTVKIIDMSLSSSKSITSFNFSSLLPEVVGAVDEANHTVSLTVPFGTDVKALVPTIVISDKSSIIPNNNVAQDFTNPVTYIVTAENGSTQSYTATVVIAPDPGPDMTPPSITSYTLNGVGNSVIINPQINPVTLVLTSSENVNWMSIKIEKEDDATVYKIFQSGANCVDGTNSCTKTWNGLLAGDASAPNGVYKIKLHMKDAANNEFYDYLSPYTITVNTSI